MTSGINEMKGVWRRRSAHVHTDDGEGDVPATRQPGVYFYNAVSCASQLVHPCAAGLAGLRVNLIQSPHGTGPQYCWVYNVTGRNAAQRVLSYQKIQYWLV